MGARAELHGEGPEAPHTPAGALQSRGKARRGLPAPLPEVAGWQERVQRHATEHLADLAPLVQILDAPVPQVADNVMDVSRSLDSSIAEQFIEVPTISCSSCPSRSPMLVPQSSGTVGGSADCVVCCFAPAADC